MFGCVVGLVWFVCWFLGFLGGYLLASLVGWLVGLQFGCYLVGQHDYTKTTQQISTKLGWRMDLSPENTPLTCGTDPDYTECNSSLLIT